ncbi:MAG: type II toxin-antitoxin system PemK/MazF family toxin [Planctomycetes bacterium]|nr:type II toxin-antitoxin system PemK/MazF family toxin [Planctomycetota bacterium]
MTIRPGEYWVADIPFTSGSGTKKRPVLVLWLDGADVVAAAVTTAKPRSAFDVELADWQSAGLRRASTVRLSRLDCLEQSLPIGQIGVISTADGERVKKTWETSIKPQF